MVNSDICAVLITYNPSPGVIKNVQVLSEQVSHVVIVDNTPHADTPAVVADLELLDRCEVIRNRKNLGIATALNIGIQRAISLGCEWIFTFDQDSQVTGGYTEKMLRAYEEASRGSKMGMVFPAYRDARLGHTYAPPRPTNGDVLVGMTSGALLHRDTFTYVGPMESEFFIDQVDHEYCLRMRSLGLRLIDCPEAILIHSLGHITFHSLWGRGFATSNHSPKRRYYITRNRLVLIKRYFR